MANHSLYRGCYMVTIHWVNESDWVRHISAVGVDTPLNDAYWAFWVFLNQGQGQFSKWEELPTGDPSSWGMLETSLSGGRWGGETLLHSATTMFTLDPSILQRFRGETYNEGTENKYWLWLLDTSRGNLGWSTNPWKQGKRWQDATDSKEQFRRWHLIENLTVGGGGRTLLLSDQHLLFRRGRSRSGVKP